MSKKDKKLVSMKENPEGDWKIEDLKALARQYGIEYRQPGTSHVTFSCHKGLLTVPAHKPIKPIYVKRFMRLLDTIQGDVQ